eukprot:CAMPEP_0206371436 /NCGR_PEP_ID=MMETSP0294-20121207/6478_1 /ASSEMBLY_ACC=CAM_ASM_000327 /TAXON_ID=39354 /ORGANISM="Heterosigma akashiwo, Strain CCMP2393" /LENGTH=174 /DNA_ID=CAMNT_0053818555 /DNA_START=641 /DNA_END=1162 /DNA_ORIENTATION=-
MRTQEKLADPDGLAAQAAGPPDEVRRARPLLRPAGHRVPLHALAAEAVLGGPRAHGEVQAALAGERPRGGLPRQLPVELPGGEVPGAHLAGAGAEAEAGRLLPGGQRAELQVERLRHRVHRAGILAQGLLQLLDKRGVGALRPVAAAAVAARAAVPLAEPVLVPRPPVAAAAAA